MKNLVRFDLDEFETPRKRDVKHVTTDNATVNQIRKDELASCSYCSWNKGCNARHKRKYYGSSWRDNEKPRYPNWKLASKAKRQWGRGKLKKEDTSWFSFWNNEYYESFNFVF
jgi:hypothetical protein